MFKLPTDCLNYILKYLETCKVSVIFLWREDVRNYNTLIACLPNESKEILYKNGMTISTKYPIFNYASFCKVLSINKVYYKIENLLRKQSISHIFQVVEEV